MVDVEVLEQVVLQMTMMKIDMNIDSRDMLKAHNVFDFIVKFKSTFVRTRRSTLSESNIFLRQCHIINSK